MEFERKERKSSPERIRDVTNLLDDFLQEKNLKYGNSALDPLKVFTSHLQTENSTISGILVRIDDKLSRIKNGSVILSNDVIDLLGYLSLLVIAKDWDNKETFDKHKE